MISPAERRDVGGASMVFRQAQASDLDRVIPLITRDPASTLTVGQFRMRRGTGESRAEWTWIAERADVDGADALLAATAIWWGPPGEDRPVALDGLFVAESVGPGDRVELAAGLLTAAHQAFAKAGLGRRPEYHVFVPADWRDRPDAVAAVAWRRE